MSTAPRTSCSQLSRPKSSMRLLSRASTGSRARCRRPRSCGSPASSSGSSTPGAPKPVPTRVVNATLELSGRPLLELSLPEGAASSSAATPTRSSSASTRGARGRSWWENAYRIHVVENDAWDKIVNLRNRLFLTLGESPSHWRTSCSPWPCCRRATGRPSSEPQPLPSSSSGRGHSASSTRAVSRRTPAPNGQGTVFDYGLAQARLLTTPVLSGIRRARRRC